MRNDGRRTPAGRPRPAAFGVWLLVRGQQRRTQQAALLVASLRVGSDVVTTSGLFGTITALEDAQVTLLVAPGVELRFDRQSDRTSDRGRHAATRVTLLPSCRVNVRDTSPCWGRAVCGHAGAVVAPVPKS